MKAITPTDPKQRIAILDELRGFALLGIIFNNMLYFSGYNYVPFETLKQIIDFQLNENIYSFLEIVITAKFYTLFSILFAVGFYVQLGKHKDDSADFIKIYRRRMYILFVIGVLHNLIWSGDILLTYSIYGFIMTYFRNVSAKNLIRWSLFFILFPLLIDFAMSFSSNAIVNISSGSNTQIVHTSYPDMKPEDIISTFQNGTIPEIFILNFRLVVWKYIGLFGLGFFFKMIGIFLLGLYLASIGFFTEKSKSTSLLIACLIIGLLATISAKILGGSTYQYPPTLPNTLYKFLISVGQIFMCLGYIMLIFIIVKTSFGKKVFKYLIPVGRMALSNYLSQTIIMILIFYNFGFNLIGRVGLIPTMCIAILILVLQIIFSNIWLRYYKFGPFEWLWRSLTYKKRIKIRINNI
jgi:uncharacterized protein